MRRGLLWGRYLRLVHNFCDRECDSRFAHKRLLLTHAELASVGIAPPQAGAAPTPRRPPPAVRRRMLRGASPVCGVGPSFLVVRSVHTRT